MTETDTLLSNARPPASFSNCLTSPIWTDLKETLAEKTAIQLEDHNAVETLLAGCAHHAPFLRDLLARHCDVLGQMLGQPVRQTITELLQPPAEIAQSAMALRHDLRQRRGKLMLVLALADCGRVIDLKTLTRALSDFADLALQRALEFELQDLVKRGQLDAQAASLDRCGLSILGLGKLGGRELNYSSDIDLIVFYEPELFAYTGPKDKRAIAIRLVQKTAEHLQARTADGFVFRVDLRLRPDPGSTPVAITLDAAETYYQSIGQTWERSALIKARHCGGDERVSEDFFDRVRPFIWRRHLDFAAIADIQAMKQRTHDHHQHEDGAPGLGFDVKLGHGGIREIEFFAQIHQLIMGGKRPDLMLRPTCEVLDALAAAEDIEAEDSAALQNAYALLRHLEHRLQMQCDEQTHQLPTAPDEAQSFSQFAGFEGFEALLAALFKATEIVQTKYDALLAPENKAEVLPPDAFQNKDNLTRTLEAWRGGTYRALRTARAQEILEDVVPTLLCAFAETPDPDDALIGFDRFLQQLPSGVQLFSLFQANPALMSLIATIMGQAPELGHQLARRPVLFEGLISGGLEPTDESVVALKSELQTDLELADCFEHILDIARIWNNEARFRTGVRLLEGLETPSDAIRDYTRIAEASVCVIATEVDKEFQTRHGVIPGGDIGMLALGSFGACELGPTSDLDLTFIYHAPAGVVQSDGQKPLMVREYYTRLSQRMITAITSPTGEGRLYEVDMRLRPSGRSGIIAVSIDAFSEYHAKDAWTWETMSLTKARFVYGGTDLKDQFEALRAQTLARPRVAEDVAAALWSMRSKLAEANRLSDPIWALKAGDGGMTDADFLIEGLAILAGQNMPESALKVTTCWSDWAAALHDVKRLDDDIFQALVAGQKHLMRTRTVQRLLTPRAQNIREMPDSAQLKLAQLLGLESIEAVEDDIKSARSIIFNALNTLLPAPDDASV